MNINYNKHKEAGFTLIEIVISLFILIVVISVLAVLASDIANFGSMFTERLTAQQEVDQFFQSMVAELRSVNPSNVGSYPIVQAGTSTLVFYADYDDDGLFEQIRYFVSGNVFKRGVIKPGGNPMSYNSSNEQISDVVSNVAETPAIFTYYGSDYSGFEAPLVQPITISDIRVIKVEISVQDKNQNIPLTQTLILTPRNLRSNI